MAVVMLVVLVVLLLVGVFLCLLYFYKIMCYKLDFLMGLTNSASTPLSIINMYAYVYVYIYIYNH